MQRACYILRRIRTCPPGQKMVAMQVEWNSSHLASHWRFKFHIWNWLRNGNNHCKQARHYTCRVINRRNASNTGIHRPGQHCSCSKYTSRPSTYTVTRPGNIQKAQAVFLLRPHGREAIGVCDEATPQPLSPAVHDTCWTSSDFFSSCIAAENLLQVLWAPWFCSWQCNALISAYKRLRQVCQ